MAPFVPIKPYSQFGVLNSPYLINIPKRKKGVGNYF
jgi:hypothetical protein